MTIKLRSIAAAVALGLGAGLAMSPAQAAEPYEEQINALRESLSKYKDVYAAVRTGYFSTVGCVHYSGEKIAGHVEYDEGAMGIHFFNAAHAGPEPDPENPPILIYEPVGDELRLVGVEWFVVLASGVKERPVLFDQPFQGPMEGHEPLIPQEVTHYDLRLAVQGQPLRDVRTDQPRGELRRPDPCTA